MKGQLTQEQAKKTAWNVIEQGLEMAFEKGVYNMKDAKQIIAASDIIKLLVMAPAPPQMTVVRNETTTSNTADNEQ